MKTTILASCTMLLVLLNSQAYAQKAERYSELHDEFTKELAVYDRTSSKAVLDELNERATDLEKLSFLYMQAAAISGKQSDQFRYNFCIMNALESQIQVAERYFNIKNYRAAKKYIETLSRVTQAIPSVRPL